MSEGHVYILTNEAMPGLVKIGRTSGDPQVRANQLSTTGVPLPFEVFGSVFAPDCVELEFNMHMCLEQYRLRPDREFFQMSVHHAMYELEEMHEAQVNQRMQRYSVRSAEERKNDQEVIERIEMFIRRTWPKLDIEPIAFAKLLDDVTAEDMQAAVDRAVRGISRQGYNGPLLPQVGWHGPQQVIRPVEVDEAA